MVIFHRGLPFFFTEVPAQKAQPKPSRPAQKQTPKTRRHRCEDVRSTRLRVEICCFMICDINMTSIYDIDIWHQYEIYEIYETCWFMTSIWLESVIAVTEKRLDFGYFGQRFFWLGVTATGIDSKYYSMKSNHNHPTGWWLSTTKFWSGEPAGPAQAEEEEEVDGEEAPKGTEAVAWFGAPRGTLDLAC